MGAPEVAGAALWRGPDDLPPQLEAVGHSPWLGVEALPPWFKAGLCPPSWLEAGLGPSRWFKAGLDPPPWEVGCTPPGGPADAPMAGVPVEDGLAGRGRPLGQDLGVLSLGSS